MIDPRSIIDPSARIGERVAIGPWSMIGPGAEIADDTIVGSHVVVSGGGRVGRRSHIHSFASLEAHCVVGDRCELASHVVVGIGATLGAGVMCGAHSVVAESKRVGDQVAVAPMTAILEDVPAFLRVTGVPARVTGLHEADHGSDTLDRLRWAWSLLAEPELSLDEIRIRLRECDDPDGTIRRLIESLGERPDGVLRPDAAKGA